MKMFAETVIGELLEYLVSLEDPVEFPVHRSLPLSLPRKAAGGRVGERREGQGPMMLMDFSTQSSNRVSAANSSKY